MGKTDDWMPLRLQIWRSGTAFMMPEARGPYLDLILAYWELGPLPNVDDVLQSNARVADRKLWNRIRRQIVDKFKEKDGVLFHERCDIERALALQLYERRANAGRSGGKAKAQANTKQNPSNATAGPGAGPHTTYLEQSPDGDSHLPSGDGAKRPRKPRGTRLEADWKPDPKTRGIGHEHNLTDAEIDAELIGPASPFAEHFHGPDCKRPVKSDWQTAARNWLRRGAAGIIARRPRQQRPGQNPRNSASVTAARDQILAEAGILPNPDNALRPDGNGGSASASNGVGTHGPIVDADEWERVPGPAHGNEGPDAADAGYDRGPESAVESVSDQADGLSRGRGPVRAENTAGTERILARVAGAERAIGDPHLPPSHDARSADFEPIPAFLKRSA